MSNRKYLRLADGYHDRSPYNPYQSSGKYSTKQSNSISDSRSEKSSNINGGTGSRNSSPRSQHSNSSPRSHRVKSSYSKTKELYKRGSSSSPVDAVPHHSSSSGDQMLRVNSISTDDNFPWSQHTSSSGKIYFYNCKTEKSQWEKPREWIEREHQIGREKKKREAKEKSEHSREYSHANHGISTKEKTTSRESRDGYSSNKRDSHGHGENKDRTSFHREDNRKTSQHNQTNYKETSQVIKTTSANTFAVSTAVHRPDQLSARTESTVSPSSSLQDISPPVTPITVQVQNSSPRIGASPVISTQSPVLLAHQQSPSLQTQSPVQHNPQRHLSAHHSDCNTPPPPPPPVLPHSSSVQACVNMQGHSSEGPFQGSPKINVLGSSPKLLDNSSFNGIHVLSQSHLHPLQQATLLQAQFKSSSNVRPMTSGIMSQSPPGHQFQPIKQSNSTPGSPIPFNARLYPTNSPIQLTSVASPKPSVYPSPQTVNMQDFASLFNRGLISHTLGWPSEPMEKQAQKSSDEMLSLCLTNSRLKADLIPLNFHHNLTRMRKGVGAKRIEFLREQTRKLEASDWVS